MRLSLPAVESRTTSALWVELEMEATMGKGVEADGARTCSPKSTKKGMAGLSVTCLSNGVDIVGCNDGHGGGGGGLGGGGKGGGRGGEENTKTDGGLEQ